MSEQRRVLVVRRGGLGDTLLMTASLRALRRAQRGARLTFAGVREFAVILARHGVADDVLSSEDVVAWRRDPDRWRNFTDAIADDPAIAAAAPHGVAARSFDPQPRDERPLALQLAEAIGVAPRWPDEASLLAPRVRPGGPVMLAPGSGGRAKCWPRDRWLALAASPALRDVEVHVIVGPAEIERDDPRRWSWPRAVEFVVELEPVDLAARFEHAALFVGNDSGTTHLAAMLGVPSVALFGPSDPRVWAPAGDHVTVVRGDGASMDGITVDGVAAAVATARPPDQGSRARTRSQ